MTNQNGIRAFLNEIKQRIEAYQHLFKGAGPNVRFQSQAHRSGQAAPVEEVPKVPLQIGNELLITEEIVEAYQGLLNALGRVVIIDQISSQESRAIKASAFGIQVHVDLPTAQQMRAAYVRREQT